MSSSTDRSTFRTDPTAPVEAYLTSSLEDVATDGRRQPWDAVVIGAGTAGITAARTLVEAGHRVAMIEAGPVALLTHASTTDLRFDNAGLTRFRQRLEYSPRLAGGIAFGQLIACLGGRAMFWNGAAPRFASEDFADWPFGLDDLEPYYTWAEREFRVNRDYGSGKPSDEVLTRMRATGLPAQLGPYAIDTRATRDGWISGTVGNPVAPLLRANLLSQAPARLKLVTHAFAEHIDLGAGANSLAVTIHGLQDAAASADIAARSVVLAGGGFESVRLAMSSRLPDSSGLMGRFLADHLFSRAYYQVPASLYDPDRPGAAIISVPADHERRFQLEVHMPGDNLFMLSELTTWGPTDDDPYYAAMVRSFAPVEPRPENMIELGSTTDPGDYTVHLDYSDRDRDLLDAMAVGIDNVRSALGGAPAQVQRFPAGASHHEAGGLRMGADPARAVTDPFGRLHAAPRVVVADAASWPHVSAANPCLTITAVARRQAEQLARDLN